MNLVQGAPGAILSCTQDFEPEELKIFDEFSTFQASSYDRVQKLQQLLDVAASRNPHFFQKIYIFFLADIRMTSLRMELC